MTVTLAPTGCSKISAVTAHPPFAGGAGIAQHDLRHWCMFRLPLKPAVDQPRVRRRLHAGAGTLDPRLHEFKSLRGDTPVFLPLGLFNRMGPGQRKGRDREHLHDAG
jgi:hypothetical protein